MNHTKIICTLGPACDDDVMRALLVGGMDCARMNFSHGNHEEHLERLTRFRRIRDELGLSTAVLLDTKGPEIRCGDFEGPVDLVEGQPFLIAKEDVVGTADRMSLSYKELARDIEVGQLVLVDDGLIGMRVTGIEANGDVRCIVENGATISSKKSVNLPGANIQLPSLTEKDEADIAFACANDFDFIAISFVRKADDVLAVRKLLESCGNPRVRLIAKIENQQGLTNLDEIVSVSDGIMIARGDLGVEIPVENVPVVQKAIIKKCLKRDKIVITATQMLDSMIRNPRPTRAETSDVANAIYDGSTCTMLSGETANGKYPVEALKTMVEIARTTEASIDYWKRMASLDLMANATITDAISYAACTTAMELSASVIVTVSKSGHTARSISRFHPGCPIICGTPDPRVQRQLMLSWGVIPFLCSEATDTDDLFNIAIDCAERAGLVKTGDMVVITAGVPIGVSGTTNMIKAQMIGNILCGGKGVSPGVVSGEVLLVRNPLGGNAFRYDGRIVVTNDSSEAVLPLLRKARGLILDGIDESGRMRAACLALGLPMIAEAYGASKVLKNGTVITMDASLGLVKHA